jgi:DNA-directed RNA polymerase specialized sigma24 family protein
VPGDTLNTTALVHETYLDMVQAQMSAAPRDILAYAARAMRNLLIDEARRKGCAKRGGDLARTELDSQTPQPSADDLAQTLALGSGLASFGRRRCARGRGRGAALFRWRRVGAGLRFCLAFRSAR